MFFKKKKQNAVQPVIQTEPKSRIQKIEEALSKPQKNEDRISLVNLAQCKILKELLHITDKVVSWAI